MRTSIDSLCQIGKIISTLPDDLTPHQNLVNHTSPSQGGGSYKEALLAHPYQGLLDLQVRVELLEKEIFMLRSSLDVETISMNLRSALGKEKMDIVLEAHPMVETQLRFSHLFNANKA